MSNKRVGQILREARESRRLTVRDVSKDTNIAIKFILALENEDYSQFPAETFAMGFLKTYSDYLKLDTGLILNLYRGEQLEESRAPLEELTKPTRPVISQVKPDKTKIITVLAVIVFAIAVIALFGFFFDEMENNNSIELQDKNKKTPDQNTSKHNTQFFQQSILPGQATPTILTLDKGVKFSVSNRICKMYIVRVKEQAQAQQNTAVLGFNIFPKKDVYKFKVALGQKVRLHHELPGLSPLLREIQLETQAISSRSAKIMVTISKTELESQNPTPTGNVPIRVQLKFVKNCFVEFIIDGQPSEQGRVLKGQNKILEANDRLEIKVSDGGAVEVEINGKNKGKLGRPGQSVQKAYYKVPDPYDSTRYQIKENSK